MASGRKSREKRRAGAGGKPPAVRAPGRRRQASPRVLAAAAAVVVLAVVATVLAVVLAGGKGSGDTVGTLPTNGSLANALPGARATEAIFSGIPQRGLTLGRESAPVTLVEYIDLQCPFCREFETQALPTLVRRYVRPGTVKIEARVLAFIGPDSSRGRDAMIAAGRQGKAFNFAQLLYDNQRTENTGWLDDAMVAGAARSIPGVNPRRLFAERDSAAVTRRAHLLDAAASADDVTETPTLFVGKSGAQGKRVALGSPTDVAAVERAIQAAR